LIAGSACQTNTAKISRNSPMTPAAETRHDCRNAASPKRRECGAAEGDRGCGFSEELGAPTIEPSIAELNQVQFLIHTLSQAAGKSGIL
jgi:hypothetical protein